MSSNKSKYFEVTTVSSVRAPNMREAQKAAISRGRVQGTEVLGRATTVERLYADDAKALARTLEDS